MKYNKLKLTDNIKNIKEIFNSHIKKNILKYQIMIYYYKFYVMNINF